MKKFQNILGIFWKKIYHSVYRANIINTKLLAIIPPLAVAVPPLAPYSSSSSTEVRTT